MSKFAFRIAVAGLLMTMFVVLCVIAYKKGETPEQYAKQQAKHTQQAKQEEELLRLEQSKKIIWQAMKAQCAANQELVANVLHSAVIKLENDATRATVSHAIWKHLNEEQREILGRAVRCHQMKPSVVQVVDVNGVVIGTM